MPNFLIALLWLAYTAYAVRQAYLGLVKRDVDFPLSRESWRVRFAKLASGPKRQCRVL